MTYSIKELQKRFGVGEHTVLGWIRNGELVAINVARKPGTKPKWRITQQALESFELRRSCTPTPSPTRSRPNRRQAETSVKFY